MNVRIEIEFDTHKMRASCRVWENEKKEHEIVGIKAESLEDVFKYLRLWEESIESQETGIVKTAKYAGYREIAEAISRKNLGEIFTTRDIAKEITGEKSADFPQTHANVSSVFSYVAEADYKEIRNVGKRGRSRIYKRMKDMSVEEIEDLLRKAP